ncbi:ketopantoate reductase family protein [Frondihabitans cladoniiphilus]|uniref:2-dehydropantoate 2-reductase N-terminal domain-containing protein n=1 Tax=Frondihabitans cladoniiphilus TaxID=715785 RepID=A0ABP8WBY1_9MICO
MRYVIVGAGAIGGVIGGRLAEHEAVHPPLLIARGEHGAAIKHGGLRVRSPETDVVVHVPSADGPDGVRLRADDVLVFATKTQAVETALRQWVDQPVYAQGDGEERPIGTAGELLPVFTALNGVESERIALRYFARVFGVCVWVPAVHLTPGEVVVRIAPSSGTFIVGRYGTAATEADRELLETLGTDWRAATFRIFAVDDVMRWKHRKLLSNLGNALQALLGPGADGADALQKRLRTEAEGVYRAAGVTWPTDAEEKEWRADAFQIRAVPGFEGSLGGSSWQSMQRGAGSVETDFLNGEIVLLARSLGLAAPLNAVVQRLTRRAAGSGSAAASMTVDELAAALDAAEGSGAVVPR